MKGLIFLHSTSLYYRRKVEKIELVMKFGKISSTIYYFLFHMSIQ